MSNATQTTHRIHVNMAKHALVASACDHPEGRVLKKRGASHEYVRTAKL